MKPPSRKLTSTRRLPTTKPMAKSKPTAPTKAAVNINAKPPTSNTPLIKGYTDQHGNSWVEVKASENVRSAFVEVTELLAGKRQFFLALARKRMPITNPTLRAAIEAQFDDLSYDEPALVVDRTGWIGDLFAWPGKALPDFMAGKRIIDQRFRDSNKWRRAGSFDAWKAEVRRLANGQHLITTGLSLAFVGPILRFFPEIENPGFELVGGTSIGKTSMLRLFGSVWGGRPQGFDGFTESMNTTGNGVETTALAHADCFLPLDEGNLLGAGEANPQAKWRAFVFFLTTGAGKATKNGPEVERFRLAFLTSNNESVLQVAAGAGRPVGAAVEVRLITLPADTGRFGVFNRLPAGSSSGADAARAMTVLATTNYGGAGSAFVKRLERELADEGKKAALEAQLRSYVDRFKAKVRVGNQDGPGQRVADKFAIAFAAGWLARRWGLLPLDDIGQRVVESYRWWEANRPAVSAATSGAAQIDAYLRRYQDRFVDLESSPPPALSDEDFRGVPGFRRRKEGKEELLVPSAFWRREFGRDAVRLLNELQTLGRLKTTDGLCAQVKVRRGNKPDRVHRIMLDNPAQP